MELEFYGSKGWVTSDDYHSCFSVQEGDTRILVDAGSPKIVKDGNIDVDAVLMTHLHLDHIKNLYNLIAYMEAEGRDEELPIYAPDNLDKEISRKVVPDLSEIGDFEWRFFEEPPERIGSLEIDYLETQQETPPPADVYCYKLKGGKNTLCLISDTAVGQEIKEFSEGSDTLICDASAPNNHPFQTHMSPNQVNELVDHVEPEKVILTHFNLVKPEEFKEEVHHGEVKCAENGLKADL